MTRQTPSNLSIENCEGLQIKRGIKMISSNYSSALKIRNFYHLTIEDTIQEFFKSFIQNLGLMELASLLF